MKAIETLLLEFGVDLTRDVEIRVWDSTAEIRYLMITERPAGTAGMSEADPAALVSRDEMVGTDLSSAPEAR